MALDDDLLKLREDGSNYHSWRETLLGDLRARAKHGHILIEFVENEPEPPAAGATLVRTGDAAGLTKAQVWSLAMAHVVKIIRQTTEPSHHQDFMENTPFQIMASLQERYLPSSATAISTLEGRLRAMDATIKDTPYDTVRAYFNAISDIVKERALIGPDKFADSLLLSTAMATLMTLGDEDINFHSRIWEHLSIKKPAEYTYDNYKSTMLQLLLSEKTRDEIVKQKGSLPTPPVASANAATTASQTTYSNKRGRSGTNLNPNHQPVHKRSRADLRGAGVIDKNGLTCGHCGKKKHTEEECWKLHPELRPAWWDGMADGTDSKSNKRSIPLYLMVDTRRDVYTSTVYKATVAKTLSKTNWWIDSGASEWICKDRDQLTDIQLFKPPRPIRLGDDSLIDALGYGTLSIELEHYVLRISDVLYAPKMRINLASVSCMVRRKTRVSFLDSGCTIERDGHTLLTGTLDETLGLYKIDGIGQTEHTNEETRALTSVFSMVTAPPKSRGRTIPKDSLTLLWHRKLGHMGIRSVKALMKEMGILHGSLDDLVCESCIYGKQTEHVSHRQASQRATEPLGLIHMDLNGPWQVPSLYHRYTGLLNKTPGLAKHVVVIVDDYTGYIWVDFVSTRGEFRDRFQIFLNLQKGSHDRIPQRLRMDNAGEFTSHDIQDLCAEKGIEMEPTAPYAHQQNGVAERANRTLREMAATMLIESGLPEAFWAEAFRTAVYIRNRSPTSREKEEELQGKSPYEALNKRKPIISHLQPFGCLVYVTTPREKRRKLLTQHRAWKGIIVGFTNTSSQYRVWDITRQTIAIVRDANVFPNHMPAREKYEHYFPSWKRPVDQEVKLEEPFRDDNDAEDVQAWESRLKGRTEMQLNIPALTSQPEGTNTPSQPESTNAPEPESQEEEAKKTVLKGIDLPKLSMAERAKYQVVKANKVSTNTNIRFLAMVAKAYPEGRLDAPRSYEEALERRDAPKWLIAIEKELSQQRVNETWIEVKITPDKCKLLGARWVFTIKHALGEEPLYKVRLVIKGYEQRFGLDYTETYAPVVKMKTIRTLLAIVCYLGLYCHQMDVKTAFLNAFLPENERVYMKLPPGYAQAEGTTALLLYKSLYGLKQAPFLWNQHLNDFLTSNTFPIKLQKHPEVDECLYIGPELIVVVYVDDILLISANISIIKRAKSALMEKYEMKDLGEARRFLGVNVTHDREKGHLRVDQNDYAQGILERFDMAEVSPRDTPMKLGVYLSRPGNGDFEPLTDGETQLYRSMLGSIMYLATGSRPDIACAVAKLGQHANNANTEHLAAMDWLFRYLAGTRTLGLTFTANEWNFHAFSDADFAETYAPEEIARRSTSGYTLQMCGASVT
jgi:transposase InsO family protein